MAGLLDTDPSDMQQLQGLLAQFEPSPEVKAAAQRRAQMQFFLGLLGAPKGGEFQAIGKSGLGAMQSYQDQIKQEQAQRTQNVQAASQVMNMLRQQRLLKTAQQIMQGDDATPGVAPQAPAPGVGVPGGANVQTAPYSPAGQQMQPVQQPQQPALSVPTWRQLMPRAEQAMALASGDPKTIVESIRHYTDTKLGPNGLVTTVTGIPLYQSTDAGIQMFSPNGAPAEFMPYSQAATNAAASRAGAISGAQTAATEAERAKLDLIPVPLGNGQTQMMTRADAARMFSQGQQQPAPGVTQATAPNDAAARAMALAADRRGQQVDISVPRFPSVGGGIGTTPNPLAMKQAEAAIGTQAEQNSVIAKGQGQDYLTVIDSEKQAPGNIAKYELMKNYLGKIETGKLAPSVLGLKSVAAYVAPNIAKDFTKDVPYAQAVSALSNEIALQLRNPQGGAGMPGSMSDADRNFLVSMAANVSNDPRAIPMMIDARIAIEKRNQEIGKIARAYYAKHQTIDGGFYQELQDYSNSHPMFQGVDKGSSAAPAGWSIKRIN